MSYTSYLNKQKLCRFFRPLNFSARSLTCPCSSRLIMFEFNRLIVSLLLVLNVISLVCGGDTEFDTKYGKIKGELVDGYKGKKVVVLRGVPFAKPPIGDLRFKKPAELDKFPADPFDATKNAPLCIQMMNKKRMAKEMNENKQDDLTSSNVDAKGGIISILKESTELEDSEDCLYMNIYIPVSPGKGKSMVMYLHGGMFISGGASPKAYDFSIFSTFGDVIVAVPQFRLSVLGFLHANVTDDMPGNQGLWDQNLALKFLNEISESIGGSKSITLMGSSSGSWSVGFHMFSPQSQNLFQRAIFESGSALAPLLLFPEEASIVRFKKFAASAKCADIKKLEKETEYKLRDDTFDCVRKLSLAELLDAAKSIMKGGKDVGFVPCEDQNFFGGNPFDTLVKNEFGTVKNVIMGTNSNEGGVMLATGMKDIYPPFKGEPKLLDLNQLLEHAKKNGANSNSGQMQLMLPMFFRGVDKKDPIAVRNHLQELIKDGLFVCPDLLLVDEYTARPGRKLFYYLFDHRPANSVFAPWLLGSQHYDELQYTLGYPFRAEVESIYPKNELDLSKKMMTLWSNFIKTGNPVFKSKIKWQACSGKERSHLIFSGKSAKSTKGFLKNHCKDLTRYYSMGRSFLKNYKNT